ncbi:MAG TPA: hypothetical protein VLF18_20250 [Tahibacter sp.]|uniref:hypothetical protein n=1 Tax=Tahibacter sp. TaxID=2056211 RepID=UPI002CC934C6|nr:hypothetical protein [Tahibacter sp.]HSX62525.1 hypothetical protein [Tahibacter sp.]
MHLVRLIVLLALSLAATSSPADEPYVDIERSLTPEQLRETGLDTLTPAQLARLNALLRDRESAAVRPAPAAVAHRPAVAAAPHDEPAMPIDLEIRTIKSRLRGSIASWAPGTEFRLENGQTWKVLKGEITLRKPLDAPEILVVPGIAGRWFLQVHEDYPKARVYRMD